MRMSAEVSYCYYSSFELYDKTTDIILGCRLMNLDIDKIFDECENKLRKKGFMDEIEDIYLNWYENEASDIEKSLLGYYFVTESSTQLKNITTDIINNLSYAYLGKEKETFTFDFGNKKQNLPDIKNKFNEVMKVKNQLSCLDNEHIRFLNYFLKRYDFLVSNINHTFNECISYFYDTFYANKEVTPFLNSNVEEEFLFKAKPKKISKKNKKTILKRLSKSVDILSKFLGTNKTQSFVKNEEVFIEGKLYNYKIKNTGNLILNTERMNNASINYDLKIFNKNGDYLSKLCIVFPNCPILDQVLSVYLMISSGKEEELLKTSNFFDRQDSLYNDNYLCDLKGFKKQTVSNRLSKIFPKKSKKELFFNSKRAEISKKIERNLFKGLGIKSVIIEEFYNQELSFDEKVDFYSSGIELPKHLDILKSSKGLDFKNNSNQKLLTTVIFNETLLF